MLFKRILVIAFVAVSAFLFRMPAGFGQEETVNAELTTENMTEDQGLAVFSNEEENAPEANGVAQEMPEAPAPVQAGAGTDQEAKPIKTTLDTLEVKDVDILDVLKMIADQSGLSIIADDQVRGRVTIFLKNVDVFDALRIILDANNLAFVKDANTVRVVTAQEFEDEFGYAFSHKIQTRMITLKYASPSSVKRLLEQIKSEAGKVIYSEATETFILIDTPESLQAMAELVRQIDVPVESKVFDLRYLKPKEAALAIQVFLTENVGRLDLNEEAGQITVTDTPEKVAEITKRIADLDQPKVEILVETKILQIILNDEHQAGVDWEAIVSDYKTLAFKGFNEEKKGALSIGTVNEEDYMVLLDALDTVGVLNKVSNVKLITSDKEESTIVLQSSDLLSPYEREELDNYEYEDEQIRYHLRPKIEKDENGVLMHIRPRRVSGGATEEQETSTADILVPQGSTVVIGGLFRNVLVEANWKIPLLGDLPLLGFAFRNEGQRQRQSEIIVFLTPKVVVKE